MPRSKPDKQSTLGALADYVLDNGLNTASLRPMAAAAGTSDRMLIYHFGRNDRLVDELLKFLAKRMANALDKQIPPGRFDNETSLVREVSSLLDSADFAPFLRVWLDIVSAAAQGSAAHRTAGAAIVQVFLSWIEERHPSGAEGAAHVLALFEGVIVLGAVGQHDIAKKALDSLQQFKT